MERKPKRDYSQIHAERVYDARTLGKPRMLLLGLQFAFAMFSGNVIVALLTGLDTSLTILWAGLATLLCHFITKGKVPVFLGGSFALLVGYQIIAPNAEPLLLMYAAAGMVVLGLVYVLVGQLIRVFGVDRVMSLFPTVVTAPIIICIGAGMAVSNISSAADNWLLAVIALGVAMAVSMFGKGFFKLMPVLLGIVVSYIVGLCTNAVDFTPVKEAAWIGLPFAYEKTVFSIFGDNFDGGLLLSAILTVLPLGFASLVEHIGDIVAVGSACKKDFTKDPGLHRTLAGDGLGTAVAAAFGGPSNTTFTEGTACLTLTNVYDPRIVRIAAVITAILGFCPKLAALVNSIPTGTLGGVMILMYGTLTCVGFRSLVTNKVDFDNPRNQIIAGSIFILAVGVRYGLPGGIQLAIGNVGFSLSSIAVGAIVGILLNLILPGRKKTADLGDIELDAGEQQKAIEAE